MHPLPPVKSGATAVARQDQSGDARFFVQGKWRKWSHGSVVASRLWGEPVTSVVPAARHWRLQLDTPTHGARLCHCTFRCARSGESIFSLRSRSSQSPPGRIHVQLVRSKAALVRTLYPVLLLNTSRTPSSVKASCVPPPITSLLCPVGRDPQISLHASSSSSLDAAMTYVDKAVQTTLAGLAKHPAPTPAALDTAITTPPPDMPTKNLTLPSEATAAISKSMAGSMNLSPNALRKKRPSLVTRISLPEDSDGRRSPPPTPTHAGLSPPPERNRLHAGHTPMLPRSLSPSQVWTPQRRLHTRT